MMTCNLHAIATKVPVQTFRNEGSNVELAKVVWVSVVSADIQKGAQHSTKDLVTYGGKLVHGIKAVWCRDVLDV